MNQVFLNWHFMRWFRLGLGVFIAIQAIQTQDVLVGLISAFLLFQAIANVGCCGAGYATTSKAKGNPEEIEKIEFEEVKTK